MASTTLSRYMARMASGWLVSITPIRYARELAQAGIEGARHRITATV